jgi:hypothetical protein
MTISLVHTAQTLFFLRCISLLHRICFTRSIWMYVVLAYTSNQLIQLQWRTV